MESLSLEQIEVGRAKILANAGELLKEARLLLEHGHQARAYALAHLACEEMAKLPMLVRAGLESALGKNVDWKKFARRFRDHSAKINNIHTLDCMLDDVRPDDSDVTRYRDNLASTPQLSAMKNTSLYTSFQKGVFSQPMEAIQIEQARAMLAKAAQRLGFFTYAESITGGKIGEVAGTESARNLFQLLEHYDALDNK